MCRESAREEPEYLCRHSVDHDDYLKSALFSEIQILQLLKSDNVVKVLDVMESSHNYYIIQEICDSDLEHYIEQHKEISEQEAIGFLRQICNGFIALVKEGIVHRSILTYAEISNQPISCSIRA
jgi:serine/threonine protein kinase